jgi:peroxiredoxin Q/BCP
MTQQDHCTASPVAQASQLSRWPPGHACHDVSQSMSAAGAAPVRRHCFPLAKGPHLDYVKSVDLNPKRDERKAAMIEAGQKAPDFDLPTDTGGNVKLSKLKGKPVVVYFYPKDDTSGCTKEAQTFSELSEQFKALGTRVIGISPDTAASHAKFRTKYDLTVDLAADPDRKAIEAYGVWVEKSMYGRKYMGVDRSTFLIDATGRTARVWRKVKVPGHAVEVLEAVKALGS